MDGFLAWISQNALTDLNPATPEQDGWSYALVTLVFRFFAVFFVLWLIQVGMQFSARIIKRIEEGEAEEPKADAGGVASAPAVDDGDAKGPDARTIAAIGIALELDSQPEAVRIEDRRSPSAWSVAGRVNQLRKR